MAKMVEQNVKVTGIMHAGGEEGGRRRMVHATLNCTDLCARWRRGRES